jgi:uncharacterized membrane protein
MTLTDPTLSQSAETAQPGGRMASERTHPPGTMQTNVGTSERMVSLAAGAILVLNGLGRRDLLGLVIAGVGGAMVHRGTTGYCHMYSALGYDTAHLEVTPEEFERESAEVAESYLIGRSREELYIYWRNLENLPRIMTHLESVSVIDDRRSHWIAKAPRLAGGSVEWDAEIVRDEPNTRIEWRSLPGAEISNRGSVEFSDAPGDRGTFVRVTLEYLPPGGTVGRYLAKLFGEEPEVQIREDLRNFKRIMETGEVVTVAGQPRGACLGKGKRQAS